MTDPAHDPSQPVGDQPVERLRRYLGILSDFSRIAMESADLDRLLQLACVQAARGIGIGHTKVMRHRAQEGELLVEAGVGWKPGVVGQVTLGTDIASPPGRTLQSREPTVLDDLPGSGEFRYSTMLREQRHRDKNDFQLIVSLLMLQARQQRDPEARRGFQHVMDRVAAISMAHDQLAAREGPIDVADYLRALCGNLDQRREGVRIEADLDRAVIAHGHAVALGLIVNELVTNALKHAFPGDRQGTVRVTFRARPEAGQGRLCVADDGVGMGPPRPGGSGLELARALARKVGGEITMESSGRGTTFRVDMLLVR